MRQDTWVRRYLDRHSFVVRYCHLCSRGYYSDIAFVVHLVQDHDERDATLLRFLGRDLDEVLTEWPCQPYLRPEAMPASS